PEPRRRACKHHKENPCRPRDSGGHPERQGNGSCRSAPCPYRRFLLLRWRFCPILPAFRSPFERLFMRAYVIGNVTIDETIAVAALPEAGASILGTGQSRDLGGKGANQAVVMARCGLP